ncbi:hypothetical protein CDD80_6683 [Ophiocordyceps camponoti-rufipedis]|uniref:homogentisate 1,2-dioxygenase n=1 Tax=Ophiocordyceps camponoti-rufipedis TaxID=2004952 RepID=A0A2C5ZFS7_9HYPO|nr:hypothetical protein CDD80_6683 [Ophiocordyceps camponoti-rufipedis]
MSEPLTKVDSAVQGLSSSPPKEKGHRRTSSSAAGVMNINDLGRKINSSPMTVDDPSILKIHLTKPPVKKIDLHFPLGMEVTARNLKGVTIKDAMDAIYKAYKKRADDELDNPYLAGFEWDKEESWTRLVVHLQKQPSASGVGGGKKKKSKKEEESSAIDGALPIGQNSPQRPAHGLYAEKLSGTSFTAPRHSNQQTWLYRKLPSCSHPAYQPCGGDDDEAKRMHYLPNQLRWDPFDHDEARHLDFVAGLKRVGGAGDPALKQGFGLFVYAAGRSMDRRDAFYSADGDLLVVAQEGPLDIRTELGWLLVRPMEVCVLPRGVRYRVKLVDGMPVRGYALELYQGHFALPELGPIGSNGLANARDFQAPVASFDDDDDDDFNHDDDDDDDDDGYGDGFESDPESPALNSYAITVKFNHTLFTTRQPNSPFDVVAWQGNYYPYKYDLGRFNTMGTVSFDHPDPSIFTVLTAHPHPSPGTARTPSDRPGTTATP